MLSFVPESFSLADRISAFAVWHCCCPSWFPAGLAICLTGKGARLISVPIIHLETEPFDWPFSSFFLLRFIWNQPQYLSARWLSLNQLP